MIRLFLFILITAAVLMGCQETKPVQTPQANADDIYNGPVLSFNNIETYYSKSADVKLRLVAPTQWHMQNDDEVFPDGVHITFFDPNGNEKTTLISDSARYIVELKTYRMVGNVEVFNIIENQKLETPILNLDERAQEIFTDTTVKITTEKEFIYGIGLRAKQDFSQYKIAKPTGIFSIENDPNG